DRLRVRTGRGIGPGLQRRLPTRSRRLPRRAGLARVVPDGALLPLRDRRARQVAPRGHPPRAVAVAGRRGGDRARLRRTAPARRAASLPLLAQTGRARLAARATGLNTLRR